MPASFPIIPKYNATADSTTAPTASALQLAELAVNTASAKIYLKANSGVVEIGADKVSASSLTALATPSGVPQLDSNGHIPLVQLSGITTSQIADLTTLATPNKIPQLDSSGKISAAQLPAISVGALTYKGVWDVNTSPVIASGGVVDSGTALKGDYYVVGTGATVSTPIDGKTQFLAGDHLAFNGSTWDLIHGATTEVISVNSKTPTNGNITLTAADVSAVATADLTPNAVPNKVPQLLSTGLISFLQLPRATDLQLGAIRVGSGLSIDGNTGVLSVIPGSTTITPATTTTIGGVIIGNSLTVDTNGLVNVASAGTY